MGCRSISNIEFDQLIRPRARSQSHNPQWPLFSATSMRKPSWSHFCAMSRARFACH